MSTEIRYELIKDEFWYVDYLGFKIVMIRNIGYINGTKLCEKGGKKIKDWLNNSNNQDLIMYFNKKINGSFTSLVKCRSVCMEMFSRKGDPNEEIRGTYIHPLLITFIADWISSGFGFVVNHIFDDLNKDLEQKKNLNLEEKLESVTRELMISLSNFKILERTNIKLLNENETLTAILTGYKEMVGDSRHQLDNLLPSFHSTIDLLKSTTESLNKSRKRLHSSSSENGFALLLKNCCVEPLPYYIIKCRNERMEPTVKRLKRKYPNAQVVFSTDYVPSGTQFYRHMKELPGDKSHLNHYDPACSEQEICALLKDKCSKY